MRLATSRDIQPIDASGLALAVDYLLVIYVLISPRLCHVGIHSVRSVGSAKYFPSIPSRLVKVVVSLSATVVTIARLRVLSTVFELPQVEDSTLQFEVVYLRTRGELDWHSS